MRGTALRGLLLVLCGVLTVLVGPGTAAAGESRTGDGRVAVLGTHLMRDGRPWIPHGFYQIAFEVSPANLARADHQFWANAHEHYTPAEYADMRRAGADSVRLQIAQDGADPADPHFDRAWRDEALGAVRAARAAGLTAIVSVQPETHVPHETPIDLPDAATARVWQDIAPQFKNDRGVLYELMNEPRPTPTPQNWRRWADTMNTTVRVVRATGATNVLVADGLSVGHVLDGAPLLADPQVAYASHPYVLPSPQDRRPEPWEGPQGQTAAAWDAQFGRFAERAPVIVSEWNSGGYYCDPDTPASTVRFLGYLQAHHVGLEAVAWDWQSGGFGSARWAFPTPRVSRFSELRCHQDGYGAGTVLARWYASGVPPTSVG